MTNKFVQVNKDLYKLGLNANEQLIISYILEWQLKGRPCFITDEAFAEWLGASTSTVSRTFTKLEKMGYITRKTENVKGGKKRYLTVNISKIDEDLAGNNLQNDACEVKEFTNVNLPIDKHQNDACTNVNLPIDNRQNDLIKDNIKDNIKTKEEKDNCVVVPEEKQEQKIAGNVSKVELKAMFDSQDYKIDGDIVYIMKIDKYFRLMEDNTKEVKYEGK